jgi:hypothetical protein
VFGGFTPVEWASPALDKLKGDDSLRIGESNSILLNIEWNDQIVIKDRPPGNFLKGFECSIGVAVHRFCVHFRQKAAGWSPTSNGTAALLRAALLLSVDRLSSEREVAHLLDQLNGQKFRELARSDETQKQEVRAGLRIEKVRQDLSSDVNSHFHKLTKNPMRCCK